MTTGQVTYLDGPESVQLKEYELPTPSDGDVLAEILRANVCGSELHIWRSEHPHIEDTVSATKRCVAWSRQVVMSLTAQGIDSLWGI